MKNQPSKIRRSTKIISAIWVIIVVVIIAIWSYSAIKEHLETPKNLGPQLEYIGKDDYGCDWRAYVTLTFPFCTPPGTTYYFATNLTEQELDNYFKNAKVNPKFESSISSSSNWQAKVLYFESMTGNFSINAYDNKNTIITSRKLKTTHKKLVLSIDKKSYPAALKAL